LKIAITLKKMYDLFINIRQTIHPVSRLLVYDQECNMACLYLQKIKFN